MPWYDGTGVGIGKRTFARGEGVPGDVCGYRSITVWFSTVIVSISL